MTKIHAIVTAGGIGSRMNLSTPKQFVEILGKPLIVHTLENISSVDIVDEICVVCQKDWIEHMHTLVAQYNLSKVTCITTGGTSGCNSIKNGLNALAKTSSDSDMIMIHDGNRPLIEEDIIKDAVKVCEKYGNAVAAIPCVEVVYDTKDGITSNKFIERSSIKRTQTPHIFYYKDLVTMYSKLEELPQEPAATCDLCTSLGAPIHFSRGSIMNFKITYPEDIELLSSILARKS